MARCTAKNRKGEQCGRHAIPGKHVCKLHGGKSLSGVASPNFKHGRYSANIPTRIAARYHEAVCDPNLLALRDDIALVDARVSEMLGDLGNGNSRKLWQEMQKAYTLLADAQLADDAEKVSSGIERLGGLITAGAGEAQAWADIIELLEQRRKLVESEQKRLVAMQQMITSEQAVVLISRLLEAVRHHVVDRTILNAIGEELNRLVTIEAG